MVRFWEWLSDTLPTYFLGGGGGLFGRAGGAGVEGIRPGGVPFGLGVEGMPITGRWRTIAISKATQASNVLPSATAAGDTGEIPVPRGTLADQNPRRSPTPY